MRRQRYSLRPQTLWGLSLLTLLLLSLLLVLAPAVKAQSRESSASVSPQGQVFSSDLTVTEDDSYEGDVTVMSGNVVIEDGGLIEGNLVVWSGNVEIRAGGEVEGDVTALSGNIHVAGDIGGSVAAMTGDIELTDSASVEGDVSVMSGAIARSGESEIGGNIVEGPGLKVPQPFAWSAPTAPQPPSPPVLQTRTSFLGWLGWLMLRLLLAVLFTALVVVLVVVLHNARPGLVQPLRRLIIERTAYNFVVGVIVNLVLAILTGGLIATVCLAPVGLLTGLVLAALNLVAWAATSHYVGERIAASIRTSMQPTTTLALGALISTGVIALLWALGGCFRPLAFLLWLLGSAPSVGALIVYTLKLDGRSSSAVTPVAGAPATAAEATPSSGARSYPAPASDAVAPAAPAPVEAPIAPVREEIEFPPAPPMPTDLLVIDEPSTPAPPAPPIEVDFTVIRGIGATFDRRLKEAGIRTFVQLAALTPEQLAAILGWTPEHVVADDLLGQAQRLA